MNITILYTDFISKLRTQPQTTSCILPRIYLHWQSILTGSDHGVKSQGDGWVLTVALIEGVNLASLDSTGFSDPYVVFTCNGKTRTSSVKLQTRDPQWNGNFFT